MKSLSDDLIYLVLFLLASGFMNIARPRVSVIIPAYNVEKYLGECLQSMIDQTEKSLEILVINDGSADKTLEVARRWAQYDPRIKIFDKENGGAADRKSTRLNSSHVAS